MNNRQAGAFRELVRKEERAREKWYELHQGTTNGLATTARGQYIKSNGLNTTNGSSYDSEGELTTTLQHDNIDNLPIAPHHIYDRAIRIGSPHIADAGEVPMSPVIQRRVIRKVEVPYTHQVKVPVKTRQIIPVTVQKKVKTKKLVEIPTTKTVDEEYTEIVHQPAIRQKEIWVKKIVPERYMKSVEVKKTRKVQIPTTELQEVDDYEVVEVTENKAVEVDAYRVDEVEDTKIVEVEEYQNYELRPHASGNAAVSAVREVGARKGPHLSRRVGIEVYHPADERHRSIEEDQYTDITTSIRPRTSAFRTNAEFILSNRGNGTTRRVVRHGYITNGTSNQSYDDSSITSHTNGTLVAEDSTSIGKNLGLKLKDSEGSAGVIVSRVAQGSTAERAGLLSSDVIIYANNRPARNLTEFKSVVSNSSGPLLLQVRRRGIGKLQLTLQR